MPVNYGSPFTAQTTVSIPGTTHALGTAALLIQAYDAATPARLLQPGRLTVHPTSFDVTATFLQAQSGAVVMSSARAVTAALGNFAQAFTAQTSVTITGAAHQLGTKNLLVQVYDAATPAQQLPFAAVTVHPTTFDATVTFAQAQSGLIVLCGAADTSPSPNLRSTFSSTTSVTITGATHGLGTRNLLVQVYDAATPAQLLTPSSLTVHPTTFDVTATFLQAQAGSLVVGGSQQGRDATASLTQAAQTPSSTGLLAVQASASLSQSAQTPSATGLLAVQGTATPVQSAQTVSSAGTLPLQGSTTVTAQAQTLAATGGGIAITGTATMSQASQTGSATSSLLVQGASGLTQMSAVASATGTLALQSSSTLVQSAETLTATGGLTALQGTASLTQSGQTSLAQATLTLGAAASVLQSPQTGSSTGVLVLQGQGSIPQAAQTAVGSGSSGVSGNGTLVQSPQTVSASAPSLANLAVPFTTQSIITIPGVTHDLGTEALLVQVYDNGSPRTQLVSGSVTVDPASFDVTVTFLDPLSGFVVLNAGRPTVNAQGNAAFDFTNVATVTIPQSTHHLSTANMVVQSYDTSTPRQQLAGVVTIDPATFTVTVTFAELQSGSVILGAYTSLNGRPNTMQAFTAQTVVSIPGTTHQIPSRNLLVQVYDNGSPRAQLVPGSLTVDPTTFDVTVTFLDPLSGVVVLNGSEQGSVGNGSVTQAGQTLSGLGTSTLQGTATLTQAAQRSMYSGLMNFALAFTGQTTVSIPGSVHQLGTAALLIEVYDAATPAALLTPGSVTVHPTTFDVTLRFLQAQSGLVVMSGASPTQASLGNFAVNFSLQTTVLLSQAMHQFLTRNLLVQVYDSTIPAVLLPGSVTVHPTTFDIIVQFLQLQSGTVIVSGAADTGPTLHSLTPFTGQTVLTIPGTTHQRQTRNVLVQVYDAQVPAALLTPAHLTVDPTSFDVTVRFAQPQSGSVVIGGSTQARGATATLSQSAQMSTTSALLLLQAQATLAQASHVGSGTGFSAMQGTLSLPQGSQTALATSTLLLQATSLRTQANQSSTGSGASLLQAQAALVQTAQTAAATGTSPRQGQSALTQSAETLTATGAASGTQGTASLAQAAQISNGAGTSTHQATLGLSQAGQSLLSTGGAPTTTGQSLLLQASMTGTSTGTLGLQASGATTQGGQTLVSLAAIAGTASATLTQVAALLTSSGQLALQATVTRTSASQTVSSVAALGLQASATLGQQPQTLTATAQLPIDGANLVRTQQGQSVTGNSVVLLQASGVSIQASQTCTASGNALATGQSLQTQAAQTLSSAGALEVQGALTRTQTPQALTAAGTSTHQAQATPSQAPQTTTATGSSTPLSGTAGLIQGAATLTGLAQVLMQATLTRTQAAQTGSASAQGVVQANAVLTQASELLASLGGSPQNTGTAGLMQSAATLSSTASSLLQASATQAQAAQTGQGQGTLPLQGTAILGQDSEFLAASTSVLVLGQASLLQAPALCSGTARVLVQGTASLTAAAAILSATGRASTSGDLTHSQPAQVMTALSQLRYWREPGGTIVDLDQPTRVVPHQSGARRHWGGVHEPEEDDSLVGSGTIS